jgi:ABC-type transporter Mla MlaB component
MLRITISSDGDVATFKMEGKLAHEWVAEVRKAWAEFGKSPQQKSVAVDLCGVSFVDDRGHELLAQMHDSGATLVGTGPMSSALIEEIRRNGIPRKGKWIRSVLSLFFLLPLTGMAPRIHAAQPCEASPDSHVATATTRKPRTGFPRHLCFASAPRSSAAPTRIRKGLCS